MMSIRVFLLILTAMIGLVLYMYAIPCHITEPALPATPLPYVPSLTKQLRYESFENQQPAVIAPTTTTVSPATQAATTSAVPLTKQEMESLIITNLASVLGTPQPVDKLDNGKTSVPATAEVKPATTTESTQQASQMQTLIQKLLIDAAAKQTAQAQIDTSMKASGDTLTDSCRNPDQYIRKDSIPCWSCTV